MITPPDPATQCLMAIPLIFLYQIGIWCSAAIERRRVEADSEPPPPPPQKGDGGAPKGLEPPDDGGPGPEPAEPSDPAPQGGAEERPGGDADPVPVIAPPETPTVARGSLDAPEPEPEPVASEPEPEPVASEPEPEPVASEPEPEPEPEPRVPEDLRAALERKKALLAGSAGVHPETGEPLPAGAFVDQNGRVWYQPEEQLEGSDGDNDDPTLDVYEDEEPADAAPVHAGEGEAEDPPEETS